MSALICFSFFFFFFFFNDTATTEIYTLSLHDALQIWYNLAFINHALSARDNGRVVGYDNSHGDHHRHFAGAKEKFAFVNYERLLERFLDEVRELRQKRESI